MASFLLTDFTSNNTVGVMINYSRKLRSNMGAEMARNDLNQHDVASALGMTQTGLSARLRGRTEFRLGELLAVADLLNVRVEVLLVGLQAASEASNEQTAVV